MKTYLIINPFNDNASHGIHNYIINLIHTLKRLNINYDYIYNDGMNIEEYREYIYSYVHMNYGYDEVIIEAPETKASTLYLENKYFVHVRLHTPGAIAQKYDNKLIDQQAYSDELRVVNKARIVSSPSYGLLTELQTELALDNVYVYKNPYNHNIKCSTFDKKFDLIFLGRFQLLKGIEYINAILEKLPHDFKVLLVGDNSHLFKISDNVQCSVEIYGHIQDEFRFDLIRQSKSLMLLSKFENCSMVILEALASGTVVCAWDVGGNAEIAQDDVLKILPLGDIVHMVKQIIENTKKIYPSIDQFKRALTLLEEDFENGIKAILNNTKLYQGYNYTNTHPIKSSKINNTIIPFEERDFGEKIFGFSISNEHIEEMWIPIVNKFNADYLFVSLRQKGHHSCFDTRYYVEDDKYLTYDWVVNPKKLVAEIKKFKPNKIFFHNGIHPSYKHALDYIKSQIDIPILYSELGWFPQINNIYFDIKGTNGKSSIALENFKQFTGENLDYIEETPLKVDNAIVIVTQTETDTNLTVHSKRFKKNTSFIEYILQQLALIGENKNIIIKTHPLDKKNNLLNKFKSKNIQVLHAADINHLLLNAKAVIGINSTLLMEALKYECNIYVFGNSLLNNKEVIIDCRTKELCDVWVDNLFASSKSKESLIEEFKARQINVKNLDTLSIEKVLETKAFYPLLTNNKTYKFKENKNIRISPRKLKKTFRKRVTTNIYTKTPFERKFCKLLFHTKFYFQDSRHPIIINLHKLYKRWFE